MEGTVFGERRRPLIARELLKRVTIVWVLLAILLTVSGLPAIVGHRFVDGDDILRLLEVRDWLAGQSWFDVTQYRIAPPDGTAMHWTRLVDIPLAFVTILFAPFVGMGPAEHVAAVLVPLITLFFVLLLIGRMSWRLFDEESTGLSCLVAAMALPLLHQLRPMRIDHHGWQVVCGLVAVNALMGREPKRSGWVAGFAMAVWLAISLEALPMIAVIMGIALARWLRCWEQRAWLVSMLQSIFVGSALIYVATRGFAMTSYCDAMSPMQLAALGIVAIGATGLGRVSQRPNVFVFLVLGTVGLAAVAAALQIAPQCTSGAFADLDPITRDMWLANVRESRAIWEQLPSTGLQIALPPLVALFVSLGLAARTGAWVHRWHLEYAVLLAAALVLACLVGRAGAFAAALAAVPLGYQLKQWLRAIRNLHRPGKQAMAAVGIIAALLPTLPLTVLMLATPSNAAPPHTNADATPCEMGPALTAIGDRPRNLLAPIDLGPQILLESPHRVVATAHHRAGKAISDNMRAYIEPADAAHAIIAKRKVDYVMVCASLPEFTVYRQAGRDGLVDGLLRGNTPDWLQPVQTADEGVLLWKVVG
ncbi:hypothetical protein EKN06_08980 [Croceicoccus ponticola]|uniref:AcrB/AcrD/AcrF family protein n=1 Tax=Croceicoccus ponticola TaxID=2217664 RepID=A0A437GZ05_9SPHN|nr:hypothetical protein [Croceicoccus ponticola]RVQ67056.1 hypothetical protein EKN06_08980 [Croceicoccus ponticola]